jgi:hypothetical protein
VCALREAGADHRLAGLDERPRGVDHQAGAGDQAIELVAIVERDRDRLEAVRGGDRTELGERSSGEDRPVPAARRLFDQETAGDSVRAVDHQLLGRRQRNRRDV